MLFPAISSFRLSVRHSVFGRVRTATVLHAIVLIGLIVGSSVPAFGGPDELTQKEREDYELMKLFVETYQKVDRHYVKEVDRRELMEAAIRGMLDHLDPYSSFIPEQRMQEFSRSIEQEFGGIGIRVDLRNGRLVVASPLPGTPAFEAGIRTGDVISEIDGQSTDGFNVDDAIAHMKGPVGRSVILVLRRDGEEDPITVDVVRAVIQVPTVHGYELQPDAKWSYLLDEEAGVAYLSMSHFSRNTARELRDALLELKSDGGMQGLILDLRSNPGGLLEAAIEIADMFLDEGEIVSVRGRAVEDRSWSAESGSEFPDLPMIVLVNRLSASASEVLSACLQDHDRAIIIGERTWGKGSVQNVLPMTEALSAVKLTTAGYHRPSGVNIHRFPGASPEDDWGVTPDEGHQLRYTPQQWREWLQLWSLRNSPHTPEDRKAASELKDPQLDQAVQTLRDMVKGNSATTVPTAD